VDDATRVLEYMKATIGTTTARHPGGWPGQSEVALIDAVFSSRASYGAPASEDRSATGVHRVLDHWRGLRDGSDLDDVDALIATVDAVGLSSLVAVNGQRVPGRHQDPMTKWEAVRTVAESLAQDGFASAEPIVDAARSADPGALERAFTSAAKGVGKVTFHYFLILLGVPGVKADTMIRAFVDEALHGEGTVGTGDAAGVPAERASDLVTAAARELGISASDLDHAIWLHQREARSSAERG
jgi:hypothetical protein